MYSLTPGDWLQAGTTVLAAGFGIGGALWGANVGARKALEADRQVRNEKWQEDRATALTALSAELTQNVAMVETDIPEIHGIWIPFSRDAFDRARPYLAFGLPENLRGSLLLAGVAIHRYNTLVDYLNRGGRGTQLAADIREAAGQASGLQKSAAGDLWAFMQEYSKQLDMSRSTESQTRSTVPEAVETGTG